RGVEDDLAQRRRGRGAEGAEVLVAAPLDGERAGRGGVVGDGGEERDGLAEGQEVAVGGARDLDGRGLAVRVGGGVAAEVGVAAVVAATSGEQREDDGERCGVETPHESSWDGWDSGGTGSATD